MAEHRYGNHDLAGMEAFTVDPNSNRRTTNFDRDAGGHGTSGDVNLKELGASLLENTTCHGIPRTYTAKNVYRRLFWCVVFLSAFGLFSWQVITLLQKYYQREVSVSLQITFESALDFPAVTICNLNPAKMSRVEQNSEIRRLIAWEIISGSNITRPSNISGSPTSTKSPTSTIAYDMDWDMLDIDYEAQDEMFDILTSVYDYVGGLNYSAKRALGHDIRDLLIDCTWKGFPCGPSNFSQFFNPTYGNCYTFNSGKDGVTRATNKPGPLYGLSLKLNVEQSEYVHSLSESAGVRVIVHPQSIMPFPEDNGFSIGPGQETSVGLRKVVIERESDPYGDCKDSHSNYDIFSDFFGVDYSQQACEKSCYNDHLISECNCVDYRFNYDNKYNVCHHNDDIQGPCLKRIEGAYTMNTLQPPCSTLCTERCSETMFRTTVTSSLWPSTNFKPKIVSDVRRKSHSLNQMALEDENFAEKNLCKLNVYYQEFNYESITESPKYEIEDFLSDMGGQMGLWIGMSFITLFEFLEFGYDVCRWIRQKFSGKAKIRANPST